MITESSATTVGTTTATTARASRQRRGRRWAGLIAAATAAMVGGTLLATPAAGAATLTATVSAKVGGARSVTATTTITASPTASASLAGICARSAAGNNVDFPLQAATLTSAGTTLTASRTLPAGTYTYWACAKIDNKWTGIGTTRTLTVAENTTPTTPPATTTPTTPPTTNPADAASPSGEAMPVGDLPGWKQIFTDDFTTDVPLGSFPGPYAGRWTGYHGFGDTTGSGTYNQKIISVSGGLMDMYLHKENGRPQVAAPAPVLSKGFAGQLYGKYTARFRADPLEGYKTAWLLWPDSNIWDQGEIDYPDGQLNGNLWGFNHCIGNPSQNCTYVDAGVGYNNWHTVSIEWSPKGVAFILDGKTLKTATTSIPTVKMHWVLQTETDLANAAAISKEGHVQIDWVAVYSYTG